MIELPYSLIIEATNQPDYFGLYSAELEGFSSLLKKEGILPSGVPRAACPPVFSWTVARGTGRQAASGTLFRRAVSGVGHSVEDCLYKAKWGMQEHVDLLQKQGLPVPPRHANPTVTIQNEQRVPTG